MQGFSFTEFMREGGWGMWPVLAFGLVAVGAAGHYVFRPEPRRLGLVIGMWLTTVVATLHATASDIAAVCGALTRWEEPLNTQFVRVLCEGIKESLRPALLAGTFLTLALLFATIGLHRAANKEA